MPRAARGPALLGACLVAAAAVCTVYAQSSGVPAPDAAWRLVVRTDGVLSGPCGPVGEPACGSLAAAVDVAMTAPPGVLVGVTLGPGVHSSRSCNVTLSRSLVMQGSGALDSVIDCAFKSRVLQVSVRSEECRHRVVHGCVGRRSVAVAVSRGLLVLPVHCASLIGAWRGVLMQVEGANVSVWVSNIVLSRCWASADEVTRGVGGGAVLLSWSDADAASHASATFVGVVFNQTLASSSMSSVPVIGGAIAAVLSRGHFVDATITVVGCTFVNTMASVSSAISGDVWLGGGALGVHADESANVTRLTVSVENSVFVNNSVACTAGAVDAAVLSATPPSLATTATRCGIPSSGGAVFLGVYGSDATGLASRVIGSSFATCTGDYGTK
jgi:hypothetical protein